MKKILVPCDFSAPAQEAFQFAVDIAKQTQGEIHVVYVLDITFLRGNPTLSHAHAFNITFLKEMENESEAKFKTMWERYAPVMFPVTFKHIIGSLLPDTEKYIREHGIDLVIMGTHGEGSARWGSNAEKLVRNCSVPVLAIRKKPTRPVGTIAVPVVPQELDLDFCEKIKTLQAFFQASLSLVWINTPRIFKSDFEAHTALQEFARDADFKNYSIHIRSDYTVENGIYAFAKEIDADMIALNTHARKGLAHFFNGSITEDLVNHVNIPVWTYSIR